MMGLGFQELLVILLILLLLFGANKIPELAKGLGKAIGQFKKSVNEVKKEVDDVDKQVKG
ncbi:MAG: twin-arginine translocase TatA/TatE family subunit [Candidatus Omnitrophica bacterium]|nr:twin-arginine translocase TatA/TatE family subunit [Candidatus Omnitrophota bacterium]